jgi:2-methylisocitrate lyase-like PEP mutase family enzyme
VLFNVWDAGSAKVVAGAGAHAIATGSWSVAAANGFEDGERLPLDFVIDNLARIVRVTDLPVTIDLESGYGESAEDVARCVGRAIAAGAVGCNLEDSYPRDGSLRPVEEHVRRIASARKAADDADIEFFINARVDVFFQKPAADHDESMVQSALERARAVADAGADGLFLPGLVDEKLIARAVKGTPLPLNLMVQAATPAITRLAELGVARVSYGPGPYLSLMKQLEEAARAAH